MARYMVEKNYVRVLGNIWQPGIGKCAMEYTLDSSDVENIGDFTRENVERWLCTHSGDFQSIDDFSASVGEWEIGWANEENELAYWDCMSPVED